MPTIEGSEETLERLEALRVDEESHDEVVAERCNSDEASELTLFHSDDG